MHTAACRRDRGRERKEGDREVRGQTDRLAVYAIIYNWRAAGMENEGSAGSGQTQGLKSRREQSKTLQPMS